MNKTIQINGRKIGCGEAPYIIAELSANHNGNLDNALKLIALAKKAGADAIKLQTYRADTLTINSGKDDFLIKDGLWAGQTLYSLYESAYTPWEWHKELFAKANSEEITIFSSPFDSTAVDLLEDLNAPAYKIASFEAIDLPLIRYVASTGKPMIISTGMANQEEIEEAIDEAKSAGCSQLAILHCVSGYPAPASDYNLLTLKDMSEKYNLVTGLSDHTIDNTTAVASVALGASIIEKHFTLDRNGGGPDDSFSLEPKDLEELCQGANTAWKALGSVNYGRKFSEKTNIKFRRSLYFVEDVNEGEIIKAEHVKSIRPGYGIAPKYLDNVIGKVMAQSVEAGTAVNWNLIRD